MKINIQKPRPEWIPVWSFQRIHFGTYFLICLHSVFIIWIDAKGAYSKEEEEEKVEKTNTNVPHDNSACRPFGCRRCKYLLILLFILH